MYIYILPMHARVYIYTFKTFWRVCIVAYVYIHACIKIQFINYKLYIYTELYNFHHFNNYNLHDPLMHAHIYLCM